MSNSDFNFDKVGKQMPYTVPDALFDDMKKSIKQQVAASNVTAPIVSQKKRNRPVAWIVATAACIAVLAVSAIGLMGLGNTTTDIDDVEYAFSQLNQQDQDYFISLNQDDIFINEQY